MTKYPLTSLFAPVLLFVCAEPHKKNSFAYLHRARHTKRTTIDLDKNICDGTVKNNSDIFFLTFKINRQ